MGYYNFEYTVIISYQLFAFYVLSLLVLQWFLLFYKMLMTKHTKNRRKTVTFVNDT